MNHLGTGRPLRRGPALTRLARLAVGVFASLVVSGCGDDPGPGFLQVTFESSVVEVGAAVLDLQGGGLGEVEGLDGSVAVAAPNANGVTRVVVSSTAAEAPRFRIAVQDLGADLPAASLVQAVDFDNRSLIGTALIQIRISKQR